MEKTTQLYAPNGWIIDIYKYLAIPPYDFDETERIFGSSVSSDKVGAHSGTRELAYGNYDRVQLRAVNNFSDYSALSSQAHDWFGTSQSVFVYPLEENKAKRPFLWSVQEETGRLNILSHDGRFAMPEGFFAVTLCCISDEARGVWAGDHAALLRQCKERLEDLTAAYNQFLERQAAGCGDAGTPAHPRILAEFFGSFSSAEMVIFWTAEQYADILYLSDCTRDIRVLPDKERPESAFSLFRSTYTTISSPYASSPATGHRMVEVRGDAYVQLAMQEGIGADGIKKLRQYVNRELRRVTGQEQEQLPEPDSFECAGEYDIILQIKSKYLPALFGNREGWRTAEDGGECPAFNIHNKQFNQYVLHTTTWLCYNQSDLPDFARNGDALFSGWSEKKKVVCTIALGQDSKEDGAFFSRTWRSNLIGELKAIKDSEFKDLMEAVGERFPAISGLYAELNQLFSDYIQCCSTSADYLWIQDYHELFQQTIKTLKKVVSYIPVRAEYSWWADQATQLCESLDIKSYLNDINKLMNALQQQTNHILASNKLFFKEQNVRFGYTAQYDLVIFAYYGIIKRLVEIIYQNSSPQTQSKLYPLVNFGAESVLGSRMYLEDSACEFLKSQKLSDRIVVIRMPLDGMNNIMHYLPMMIHEVFHYSTPKDRNGRNRLLAQFAVYQLLKEVWFDFFQQALDAVAEDDRSGEQFRLARDSAEHIFLCRLEKALYALIDKKGGAIFQGIQGRNLVKGADAPILRSWFEDALADWLFVPPPDPAKNVVDELSAFADLLDDILSSVDSALCGTNGEAVLEGPGTELFSKAASILLERMKSGDILQDIMSRASDLYRQDIIERFLEQLDEVFPDYAMVSLTDMPVAGYLLQIAMNLDMQLDRPLPTVGLRFGILLHWMLTPVTNPGTSFVDSLEAELAVFEELYCAACQMPAGTRAFDKEQVRAEAQGWSSCFRKMYIAYESDGQQLSFSAIQPWLTRLIAVHMAPALQVPERMKKPFADAYKDYLKALQMPEEQDRQGKMFGTSMQTILRFQSRRTVRSINEKFGQNSMPASDTPVYLTDLGCPTSKGYEFSADFDYDHIQWQVEQALDNLYYYRKKENVPNFTGMWYRGVQNGKYAVLPSGFVHFAEDANRILGQCREGKADYLSCLRHLYEVFRYSSEGTGEQFSPSSYTMVDHLALMQHYSQHTNLLDWSEDAYTSLYFALEDEVNVNDKYLPNQGDPKNFSNKNADAALYILDPVRFNRACEEMEERCGFPADAAMPAAEYKGTREAIPNLSIFQNHEPFREYHDIYQSLSQKGPNQKGWIVKNRPADRPKGSCLTLSDLSQAWELRGHLPRAVYTSKLNPRIKAQSGLFVAFSMLSQPAKWSDEAVQTAGPNQSLFYYQSMEALQEFYLKKDGTYPFLFKIVIRKDIRKTAGRVLYRFGMSKEKIYPELDNRRNR